MANDVSAAQPESLTRSAHGWVLQIHGFTEAAALAGYLWPHGVPHGVTVTAQLVVTEPAQIGDFEFTGLTTEAVSEMDPWWSQYFLSATLLVAEEPAPQRHPDAHPDDAGVPEISGGDAAEEIKEYVLDGTHGVLTVVEIAGMFAKHGSKLAHFGEWIAGPIGDIAAVIEVLYLTWHAFGEKLRDEKNRGVFFGIIWQVIGHPDQEPMYNEDDFFAKMPWDSFEEMKQAFDEGVADGRASAGDTRTHNMVAAAIAWQMHIHGVDENTAAGFVLTEVWRHATGGTKLQLPDSRSPARSARCLPCGLR